MTRREAPAELERHAVSWSGRSGLAAGCLAALLGAFAGALSPMWGPDPAVVISVAVATWALAAVGSTAAGMSCLLVLVVGLMGFSRSFAILGRAPIYLPETLLLVGAVSLRRTWWPLARSVRPFVVLGVLLFALNLQAVIRGVNHGYSGALKGLAMGFWPMAAVVISAILARRPLLIRLVPALLTAVTPGLLISLQLEVDVVASAYGLALALAASFAACPGTPWRLPLAVSTAAGATVLTVVGDKRGPLLAIAIGVVLTRLAAKPQARWRGLWVTALAIGLIVVFATSITGPGLEAAPGIGGVVQRVQDSGDLGTSAGRNVDIRFEMWRYAVDTALREDPLLGVGAGRPLLFAYGDNDLRTRDTGPHNSFVGYFYYSGIVSLGLVVACLGLAAYRAWRCRRTSTWAPALLGAVGAVVVTSLTNVVFETTYLGSVAWLIVGAAISLTPHPNARSRSQAQ